MYVNNTTNRLVCVNEGSKYVGAQDGAHFLRVGGGDTIHLPELQRIHKHFFHANSERLYALMRRAKIDGRGAADPQAAAGCR